MFNVRFIPLSPAHSHAFAARCKRAVQVRRGGVLGRVWHFVAGSEPETPTIVHGASSLPARPQVPPPTDEQPGASGHSDGGALHRARGGAVGPGGASERRRGQRQEGAAAEAGAQDAGQGAFRGRHAGWSGEQGEPGGGAGPPRPRPRPAKIEMKKDFMKSSDVIRSRFAGDDRGRAAAVGRRTRNALASSVDVSDDSGI